MTDNEQQAELTKQKLEEVVDWLFSTDTKVPMTSEGLSSLGTKLLTAVLEAQQEVRKTARSMRMPVVKVDFT